MEGGGCHGGGLEDVDVGAAGLGSGGVTALFHSETGLGGTSASGGLGGLLAEDGGTPGCVDGVTTDCEAGVVVPSFRISRYRS